MFKWEALTALIATMALFGAFAAWFVKITIQAEIRKLNGYYLRSGGLELTGAEIERRLEAVEQCRVEFCPLRHKAT